MRARFALTGAAALALAVATPACGASESERPESPPGATSADAESAAERGAPATATLRNADGEAVGSTELIPSPNGTWLRVELTDVPPGEHAFHLHETGACEAPDFESAGGHLNPARVEHGFLDDDGVHAGDLPNVHVPEEGALRLDVFAPGVVLEEHLSDADGAAVVMHEGPDDYRTNPAGAAGPRIACGVVERS